MATASTREDLADTLRAVRLGKQHSDLMVAALHSHEPGTTLSAASRRVRRRVRAGGDRCRRDVVVTSGIHHLAGVELYQGRPIFHGLGNFVFSDMIEPLPHELYVYGRDNGSRAAPTPSSPPTPTSPIC